MKKREKIYIIPTEYGFMYGGGIFVSLIGGAVYSNNLAFMLCFFLVALFLIGMVHTHNNLKNIDIEKLSIFLSPSEGVGHGVVWIKSNNPEGHSQIRITCKDNEDQFDILVDTIYKKSLHPQYFDFITTGWGKKNIEKLRVSTRYPFGFFYVWRNFKVPTDYFVYPQPSGEQDIAGHGQDGEQEGLSPQQQGDDFSEHKTYEPGDSMKHIDWKAYARGRPLMTKKFNEGQRRTYFLDYDNTRGNQERKVRQMSQWIHECDQSQVSYSVKIGSQQVPASYGARHKAACLKLLAGMRSSV